MKIAVITDSSCGGNIKERYKDLNIVPLMITKENGEQIKDDDNLTPDEFYTLLDSEVLRTSQSIPSDMLGAWDRLLKDYDQIIVALLSKGLSGQYNTFKMLSGEDDYKDKVFVIDTNGVSIILERTIDSIFSKIEEGKDAETIVKEVEENNQSFLTYIIPKSLDNLVRGGRISKAAAGLAKILKITPILKYNGEIDKESKTRTFKKAVNEALELIKSKTDDVDVVDISYSRTDKDTLDLVKNLIEKNGFKIGYASEMPNVITTHTGRDTFALAAWLK